ncbi:caspase family protein [Streptomyces sp. NPDC002490]|uniref:caspase family protein n=1 Tax=Streptomyces sp. NPDC002490 TaxID=3154416 RepID=UPI003326810F
MQKVNCLFVGIDAYAIQPLRGCRNDIAAAERWVRSLPDTRAAVRVLADSEARLDAVVAAIDTHLGASGPGDTALLWFSGHGSRRTCTDGREATGMAQALVCHDSQGADGQALTDDVLGDLLDGIAATGAHVVAVLDCCYSGGATREEDPRVRSVPWQPSWDRRAERGAGGSTAGPAAGPRRHVLLAASRLDEPAYETGTDPVHGVFSKALLDALADLGPGASCREVLDLAAVRADDGTGRQHPTLHGVGDQGFRDGRSTPVSRFRLRRERGCWTVNCGAVHGLRAAGGEFTARLASGRTGTAVVREVFAERSTVEPLGDLAEALDPRGTTPVVPSALAFPPAAVTVTGDRAWADPLAAAVAAHPLLATSAGGTPLGVEVLRGTARIHDEVRPLPPQPLRDADDLAEVIASLAHLAQWHRVRDLTNPDPSLSGLVHLTVEPLRGGRRESVLGESIHEYTADGRPPQVRITLHNRSDRTLWCTLLDLTDSHGIAHELYEGDFIRSQGTAQALRGDPVWLYLPENRPVRPGAQVRDWLKLIVAENEFALEPLLLPPLAPGGARGNRPDPEPLLRVAARDAGRDAGRPFTDPGDWGTADLALRTVVPEPLGW